MDLEIDELSILLRIDGISFFEQNIPDPLKNSPNLFLSTEDSVQEI